VDAGVVPPLVALLRCGPMSAAAEAAVEAISWIAEENNVDEYEAGNERPDCLIMLYLAA